MFILMQYVWENKLLDPLIFSGVYIKVIAFAMSLFQLSTISGDDFYKLTLTVKSFSFTCLVISLCFVCCVLEN